MNKKIKWAIPFAVLALSCGIAAGCGGGHEHSYTQWGYDETQHWKVCPDDHEKDESSKANHNFVDGSCECGKSQPVKDVTITNGTTDTNGTVTLSKTTGKTGDSVTVTVAPNEGYQLKSLTVNGANVFGAMTGNTYEFKVTDDTTVIAVFEKIASSSVNAVISGKKYGVTGNSLTAGTLVTLSATGRDDVVTEIKADGDNLVIQVAEIAGDNWSVKVDGYVAATILIPRDAEYTSAIALEYDLMENLKATWGNSDSVDLSKQNEGKITHKSGYVQWVSSKNSYESVAITATVGKGGSRQGVFIRFKGDNYDADKYVMVSKEDETKIGWCAMDGGSDYKGGPISPWDDKIRPLTKNEYELTLVRDGADIYFFVDGEFIDKKTFSEYANKECYVGLFCTNASAMENSERTFAIQDADEFLTVSVMNGTTDTNGTVTIDKTTANLNDEVNVTVTANQGYKIKDVKANGISVLNKLHAGVYKFNAVKNVVIVAEFEESKTVGSAEITVNAATGFVAEGAVLTFEQLEETWTGTVTNGKVTLDGAAKPVALGTHNVTTTVNGLTINLGTVNLTVNADNVTGAGTLTLDGNSIFANAESAAAGYNLKDLDITLDLKNNGNAYHNKLVTSVPESDSNYLFYKISLPEAMKTKLTSNSDKKLNFSMPIVVNGNETTAKFIMQNGNVKFTLYGGAVESACGNFWGTERTLGAAYWTALTDGDGFYFVANLDKTSKKMNVYFGTELNNMRLTSDWGKYDSINSIGISMGNGVDANGLDAGDQVTITVKYGKTMAEVGVEEEEKVTVNASVNNETMGSINCDAQDGKYYSGTDCTVTIKAKAGYYLKSIQVGSETVNAGWNKNGNVYTYKLTVPAGGAAVVATLEASPEVTLTDVVVDINDGTNKIDLGTTAKAALTLLDGESKEVTLTKETDGTYKFSGTFVAGDYSLTLKGKYVGYPSVSFTIEDENVDTIEVTYSLATFDNGTRGGGQVTVNADNIHIKGTGNSAFDEFSTEHGDREIAYAKLNLSDEAKNAKNLMLEFNLKTSNQKGWFINGFGIGMTGNNGLRMMFADGGDEAYTPDGKIVTAILNGRKISENNISGSGFCVETYGWIETLALTSDGVNMRAVRSGTTIKFYAQNSANEWVLIKFLAPANGDYGNLKYVDSVSCAESDLNDIRLLGGGAEWDITNISVTLNPENIDNASYCTANVTVEGAAEGAVLSGTEVVLTDKDDETKTYTVELKKNGDKYYIEGYFRAGNYNITVDGYTCTSAGKDEVNQPTTALWIDNVGGECWGITLTADAEVTE